MKGYIAVLTGLDPPVTGKLRGFFSEIKDQRYQAAVEFG
jgi:hypothetical protein